jgi:Mrp family chromosome partitioning ATPase
MPAGGTPPNPSELLGSAVISHLLACWAENFDVVVLDTPPIGPVADALALAAAVDGVLVVVRAGHTRRAVLRRTLEVLNGAGRTVLGLVLNELQPGPLARYSPYGYYYGGYYGQAETATTPTVALSAPSVHTNGVTGAASTAHELKRDGGGTG